LPVAGCGLRVACCEFPTPEPGTRNAVGRWPLAPLSSTSINALLVCLREIHEFSLNSQLSTSTSTSQPFSGSTVLQCFYFLGISSDDWGMSKCRFDDLSMCRVGYFPSSPYRQIDSSPDPRISAGQSDNHWLRWPPGSGRCGAGWAGCKTQERIARYRKLADHVLLRHLLGVEV
jgi:hypothetical protein